MYTTGGGGGGVGQMILKGVSIFLERNKGASRDFL